MRKIISLICFLLPFLAQADEVRIRPDAPDRHIVVKGDTLWGISTMFFSDPWKWPNIWNLNKDTIKDPHWIYPGDVVILDRIAGSLSINNVEGNTSTSGSDTSNDGSVRYSPHIHYGLSQHDAISSIPYNDLHVFLSQPLVVDESALDTAPKLVALQEGRVILGVGELGYVSNLPSDQGSKWQVYRPGKVFVDPVTGENLGREAIYLGDVVVNQFAKVSTVLATDTKLEIIAGDRLAISAAETGNNYLPHAPAGDIKARIISIYGGVTQAGQNSVVTLNKGSRDGLEIGHVLALYNNGVDIKHKGEKYTLPDERYGLLFVFRVFNKVSYGLIMQAKSPAQVLDRAQAP